MFISSLLLSLALLPDAEAANISKIKNVRIRQTSSGSGVDLIVLTPDADATVASVAAELDGEPVSFTESDAWVHGTAALSAEPADGAEVRLTVYGTDSAVLDTFAGTYTDGELTLTSTTRDGGGGGCLSRVCEDGGTSSTTDVDLEVLAAVVYADGTVGLDLAGADALSVASAALSSVETSTSEECVTYSRTGECVEYGTTTTRDDAELDLDELGIVWESDTVEVDGVAELEVKAYDADGEKLDKAKVKLAAPWEDDGTGVNVLPVDEDPLTTVALRRSRAQFHVGRKAAYDAVVVSDGWTLGDALPELAEIEIEDGETWSVPVNSYQVTSLVDLGAVDLDLVETVEVDGAAMDYGAEKKHEPIYALDLEPAVLRFSVDDSGHTWASVTTWSADPDALPTEAVLTVDGVDTEVVYDDEVAVVFAMEAELATDAAGMDLLGQLKLQGEANRKGKRETLAKGKFAGQFGGDGDGDLDLAGIDKTGDTVSRGDILIGGEPIDIEREVGEEVVPVAPPAVVYKPFSNGSGTRKVATTNTGSPGLL